MITFHQIGYLGRLGNQMFQFAATLGISVKGGFDAKFPIENCSTELPFGPLDAPTGKNSFIRCNLLDCFDIDDSYFIPLNEIKVSRIYQESIFCYDALTENIVDGTSLSGYFQTERYFLHCRDLILSQFVFKKEYQDPAKSFINHVKESSGSSKICSIHIRRGDYLMYPDYHPSCNKEYYESAVERMETEFGISKFLIFSDDPDWCKSEFNQDKFVLSDLQNPYIELCAMSLCDNHIIANSSFSWWGAWINPNEDKVVISPSKWFGAFLQKDTRDIYCPGWIKI